MAASEVIAKAQQNPAQQMFESALLHGNHHQLLNLLQKDNIDVEQQLYNSGPTPLFLSITMQRCDLVETLLKYGADACKPCPTLVEGGWTVGKDGRSSKLIYPLQKAAELECLPIILQLLEKGAHPNQYSKGLQGLITIAVKHRQKDIVCWLTSRMQVESGLWTVDWSEALMAAIRVDDQSLVDLVLEFGADPNKEYQGLKPLTVAANRAGDNGNIMAICKTLIEKGASVNGESMITLGLRSTPLSCAICHGLNKALPMLIKCGCDVNGCIDWSLNDQSRQCSLSPGASMLHIATFKRNLEAMKILMKAQCSLNVVDSERNTALHVAAADPGGLEAVKCLLDETNWAQSEETELAQCTQMLYHQGFTRKKTKKNKNKCGVVYGNTTIRTINQGDKFCNTPLMVAVHCGHNDIAKTLLQKGANIKLVNKRGQSVLHEAVIKKNEELTQLLLDWGATVDVMDNMKYTPLTYAVRNGDDLLSYMLLEQGADVTVVNSQGENMLHMAIQACNEELVSHFLSIGFDVNGRTPYGDTPLTLASRKDSAEVCHVLIQQGALLNLLDANQKETALALSIYYGQEQNAKLIIREGADLNLAERRDRSPIYWAIHNCRYKSLAFLIKAGAALSPKEFYEFPETRLVLKDVILANYIDTMLTNPRSLQDNCRLVARKALVRHAAGKRIGQLVPMLPLPSKMHHYLMYDSKAEGCVPYLDSGDSSGDDDSEEGEEEEW